MYKEEFECQIVFSLIYDPDEKFKKILYNSSSTNIIKLEKILNADSQGYTFDLDISEVISNSLEKVILQLPVLKEDIAKAYLSIQEQMK